MRDEGLSALWLGAARQVESDGMRWNMYANGCAAGAVERSILGTPFLAFLFHPFRIRSASAMINATDK
jgi:hypothetical protein